MPSFNPGTEKHIVNECLKNNRHAQKQLFDMFKDAMYTVAFRILRNQTLAKDALQDGFLQVFTCLNHYRYESSLGTWIKTIMIRCAIKILQKEMAQPLFEDEHHEAEVMWDEYLTGEQLDTAIAALSPGYRSVFLLVEVEGYSHKEVSDMLKISEGTSKSQLCRAKMILQQKLKELKS